MHSALPFLHVEQMGDILSHFTLRLVHGWQVYGMMDAGGMDAGGMDAGGMEAIVCLLSVTVRFVPDFKT